MSCGDSGYTSSPTEARTPSSGAGLGLLIQPPRVTVVAPPMEKIRSRPS